MCTFCCSLPYGGGCRVPYAQLPGHSHRLCDGGIDESNVSSRLLVALKLVFGTRLKAE